MDNYPGGINDTKNDPRSPLYEEPPTCEECGEDLALDADCDEGVMYAIAYCDNPNCDEYGENV